MTVKHRRTLPLVSPYRAARKHSTSLSATQWPGADISSQSLHSDPLFTHLTPLGATQSPGGTFHIDIAQ